jgi:hypothetical protein
MTALAAHEIITYGYHPKQRHLLMQHTARLRLHHPTQTVPQGTDITGAKDVTLSNSADILDTTAFA